jgi:NAD(P)-dependent dehydrogenase (short-subunit alcohol dehydrogenase family)/putative sterol carrier protein
MLNTGKLAGKVIYITGGSRGIGLAMAIKAAKDGAKVAIAAKTAEPHPKLPGTIYTAAKEIEAAGGQALPCIVDVRDEAQIQNSIEETVKAFGGIDIVINNASAISLTGTQETSMKTYDLMHTINTRGTYLVSKLAIPYLKESALKGRNPHILNNSPPLNMTPRWFQNHVAYTMAKYGMSMCVLGMAEEFKKDGIAVNAIWPRTAIMTAAMEMLGGGEGIRNQCRNTDIMSDAAYVILTRDSRTFTGNFCVDEQILREEGVKDFSKYLADPAGKESDLMPDFFLDDFSEAQQHEVVTRQTSQSAAKQEAASAPSVQGSGPIIDVFKQLEAHLNEDIVKKTNAVYAFTIPDDNSEWYLDLKNGSGSYGAGQPSAGKADVTFTLKSADFGKMFAGKLKPTTAFMTGKLKIAGNMGKAMNLEKLMGKLQKTRSYHTSTNNMWIPKSRL